MARNPHRPVNYRHSPVNSDMLPTLSAHVHILRTLDLMRVQYENHDRNAPAAPVLPRQKLTYNDKLKMVMVRPYNVYLLKFNSQDKYSHLELIILDCMGGSYRSKGIKA